MKKIIVVASILWFLPSIALGHSTVSPSQTATSKYETFTLSVPTEKDVPTVAIRLIVPTGLDRFTPFVHLGWTISMTKNSDGNATEIEWKGGVIPAGQKDIFEFTARTAAENTTLIWKVYQTYQGGEVVAWDQDPKMKDVKNPYSVTEIKADTATTASAQPGKPNDKLPIAISIIALVLAFIAWQTASKK